MKRISILLLPALVSFRSQNNIVLDEKVSPGDDFYGYVCNNWMKENPLPQGRIAYDVTSQMLEQNNKAIIEELKRNRYSEGSVEQKLKDLYTLGMDMKKRQEGRAELIKIFNEIEKAKSIDKLRNIQYKYACFNIGIPMKMIFGPDCGNPSKYIMCIEQPIHNQNYYLSDDEPIKQMREGWKKYIVNMLKLFNLDKVTAIKKMELVYHWDVECAKICLNRVELLRRKDNYSKISLDEFVQKYPHIPLVELFIAKGGDKKYLQELVVGQPEFLHNMDKKLEQQTVDELKSLMEIDLINTFAFYLDEPVYKLKKDMFEADEVPTLEKLVWDQLSGEMGNALGKMFCERYFPESSKKKVLTIVEVLKDAFADRIADQSWMSEKTKIAALGKLNDMHVMVGYPDKWEDYSALKIDKNKSYLANIMACKEFNEREGLKRKLGKKVDRAEWHMNPHDGNCCFYPAQNAICFPAGILQAPYFDPNADDATNFGAIGTVIGRELTRVFYSNIRRLPQAEKEAFYSKSVIGEELLPYVAVYPNVQANRCLTFDDNMANHVGVKAAYHAYKKMTKGTGDYKKFFISFAFIAAGNVKNEKQSFLTHYKRHLFGRLLVNGTLAHVDAWYEAFAVKPNNKMFIPKEKRFDIL